MVYSWNFNKLKCPKVVSLKYKYTLYLKFNIYFKKYIAYLKNKKAC